jgi:hypothetical protein
MSSYEEVKNEEGNVVSKVRRNSLGIFEVYNINSGMTFFIRKGVLLCTKDKDNNYVYPEPSAPPAAEEELKAYLKRCKLT